jgi:membrane glycosyltransferase
VDTEHYFPFGKWATIQAIQERIDKQLDHLHRKNAPHVKERSPCQRTLPMSKKGLIMGDSLQQAYLNDMAQRQCLTVRRYLLVLIALLVVGALAWWYLT